MNHLHRRGVSPAALVKSVRMRGWLFAFALLLGIGPLAASAQDNAIQDVTASQQGGNLVVRIGLKSAPTSVPPSSR